MLFHATILAKMIALVAIKMDFPAATPLFCVQLDMDGEFRNAMTDSSMRVSIYFNKKSLCYLSMM